MKLQFDRDLDYQKQAIASIIDLFKGQTPARSNFTVCLLDGVFGTTITQHGIGNRLELDEEDIQIQLRNGIAPTKALKTGHYDFDIENGDRDGEDLNLADVLKS